MIVTLICDKRLYKLVLPETDAGDYWISNEHGKKLANIIIKEGQCYFRNNQESKIISGDNLLKETETFLENKYSSVNNDEVLLTEYSVFNVAVRHYFNYFVLFCSPSFENFSKYKIESEETITIGSNKSCSIRFKSTLLMPLHATITKENRDYYIVNNDIKYGCFVNDLQIGKQKTRLYNGDIIFIMGLRLILVGNFLFINNPMETVFCNSLQLTEIQTQPPQDLLPDDDGDIEIYSEKDYFYRSPRVTNDIEREKVKVDAPPPPPDKEKTPLILMLGTTLSMGMITMITGITTISNIVNGETTVMKSLPQLAMMFGLLIGTILIPIISRKYEEKKKKQYEEKRLKKYKEYIDNKIKEIKNIMQKQKNILYDNYLSADNCKEVVLNKSPRLFERKIDDKDFLTVRLGTGNVPLEIDLSSPDDSFKMEEDELVDLLKSAVSSSKIEFYAPITTSFLNKRISSIVIKNDDVDYKKRYVENLIMQLITFHSYEELKIVFLAKPSNNIWDDIKVLPHLWDNSREFRFFADDYNDMKEISKYLEEVLYRRVEYSSNNSDYKSFKPYYLVITDDYKTVRNLSAINKIAKLKQNLGFSLLCVSNNMVELPDTCESFIVVEEGKSKIFDSEMAQATMVEFDMESLNNEYFPMICKKMSDIPIRYSAESGDASLIDSLSFLEMYDVGNIDQLNILQRWQMNDSSVSLEAPIGVDEAGMIISLDIHEKFHGPHGLIAGSTGSGKSELLITYILSLALNYHPYDVSMVLIDYKGGGLANALKKGNVVLPHLVGTITNIDESGLHRSLASIQSELRRRQRKFNEAREKTDGGTIDIYKYQKLFHDGIVKEPIPHLLIISDEFAELKQQQPDFMDELISVARIGRSLGVHLILSTQKPAGVVNDQIRSNSKFAICLKVQDRSDSNDVIGRPDAADLKRAGQFYMKVGNNEYFVLGQAAWAGALYHPSDITKKKVDTSIKFISNIGRVIKQVDNQQTNTYKNMGDQLTNIVKALDALAKKQGIKRSSLWIEEIPKDIYWEDILKKYNIKPQKNLIMPTIGEYDDPDNQKQGPVSLNLTEGGNIVIYGNAQSGKETLLSTIVYDIISTHDADEAQIYIFDFGSEALKVYKNAPQVGDVVFINDKEKIDRFFENIQKEMRRRVEILSDFGGNYSRYVKSGKEPIPLNVIIMNGYESFAEIYQNKYDDLVSTLLREGTKNGIVFIFAVSSTSDLRYRATQNFKQKIALQMNREDDYYNIWDEIRKKRPASIFGRGLIKLNNIFEFQTAKVVDQEYYNEAIRLKINRLEQTSTKYAKPIPVLPSKVSFSDVTSEPYDLSKMPLGLNKESLSIYRFDFSKQLINVISGKNIETISEYVQNLITLFREIPNVRLVVFDADNLLDSGNNNVESTFMNLQLSMTNELYKGEKVIVIIVGLDKFMVTAGSKFDQIVDTAEKLGNYKFVICETANKIKNHEFDTWFRNNYLKDFGIWIGNGIGEQYLISCEISFERTQENLGRTFGYGVKHGETTTIKLLGMEEEDK